MLVVYSMGLLGSFLIYLAVSDTAPGPVARAFLSAMEVIPAALSSLAVKVFSPLLPFLRIAAVFLARIAVTFLTTSVGSAFVFFVASFSLCWAAAWSYVYFETIRHFCALAAYNWNPRRYRLEGLLNRLSGLEMRQDQVLGKIRAMKQSRAYSRLSQPAVRTEVSTVQAARRLLFHSKDLWDISSICRYIFQHQSALPPVRAQLDRNPSLPALLPVLKLLAPVLEKHYRFRYTHTTGFLCQSLYSMRALAGPLVHHLLPLPFLTHFSAPLDRGHFHSILFTPVYFILEFLLELNPHNWHYRRPHNASFVPSAELDRFLLSLAELVDAASESGVPKAQLKMLVADAVDDGWAKDEKEEIERQVIETTLDLVLLWKEVQEERGMR